MEIQEALKIVRAMANGVNPETGEAVPPDSCYRRDPVIKAMNRAIGALLAAEERERNRPSNAGKYWSRSEDAKVCEELRNGMELQQIAKLHSRSVGSIVARLVRLGKISPPPASRAA
ncbi:MAG: hypothetical protein JST79_01265 [Acidobacteria bacterium]|jgi:hypothetical protein|nr:hypothetical protein [Acidobacteriota bacterium]